MNIMDKGKYNGDGMIVVPVDTEVERDKQDFVWIKEDKLICGNCYKPLLEVLKVKEDEKKVTAIRALCPYCHDQSFWYKISGKIYIQAMDGLSIADAPIDIRNDIMFTTIKVIKNE